MMHFLQPFLPKAPALGLQDSSGGAFHLQGKGLACVCACACVYVFVFRFLSCLEQAANITPSSFCLPLGMKNKTKKEVSSF